VEVFEVPSPQFQTKELLLLVEEPVIKHPEVVRFANDTGTFTQPGFGAAVKFAIGFVEILILFTVAEVESHAFFAVTITVN
jgi:hypothetical protein